MSDISDFAHHPPAEATSAPDPSLNVPTPSRQVMYHVVHRQSGKVVGKASTRKGARLSQDRHDNAYGSYAHKIVEVGSGKERL